MMSNVSFLLQCFQKPSAPNASKLISKWGIRCVRVVSVGDFETGCPGFDPPSRHYGHGGVPLGKAHFLA